MCLRDPILTNVEVAAKLFKLFMLMFSLSWGLFVVHVFSLSVVGAVWACHGIHDMAKFLYYGGTSYRYSLYIRYKTHPRLGHAATVVLMLEHQKLHSPCGNHMVSIFSSCEPCIHIMENNVFVRVVNAF